MSTVSLNLPESLYKQVCQLAQEDGISLNQFIVMAVAEKVAALKTVEYL
jgi:predicted HicB family RNase H-like nuclease